MISLKHMLPFGVRRWARDTNLLSRAYRDRRRITPRPVFMYIEVTTRCNLACRMCCRDALKPGEVRDLEFERFQAIANEAEAFPGIAFHLYGIGFAEATVEATGQRLMAPKRETQPRTDSTKWSIGVE